MAVAVARSPAATTSARSRTAARNGLRARAEDALRHGAEPHPQRDVAAGGHAGRAAREVTGVVRRSRFGRRPSARPVAALTDAVTTQVAAALARQRAAKPDCSTAPSRCSAVAAHLAAERRGRAARPGRAAAPSGGTCGAGQPVAGPGVVLTRRLTWPPSDST